jgi:hypothetical protein
MGSYWKNAGFAIAISTEAFGLTKTIPHPS